MILQVENPKDSKKDILLEQINQFSKLKHIQSAYKISSVYIHNRTLSRKEIKKTVCEMMAIIFQDWPEMKRILIADHFYLLLFKKKKKEEENNLTVLSKAIQ